MNISLPEPLKAFVEEQVAERGYGTSSEFMRELIRKDQAQTQLRDLLFAGARSPLGPPVDDTYFEDLHDRIRRHSRQ